VVRRIDGRLDAHEAGTSLSTWRDDPALVRRAVEALRALQRRATDAEEALQGEALRSELEDRGSEARFAAALQELRADVADAAKRAELYRDRLERQLEIARLAVEDLADGRAPESLEGLAPELVELVDRSVERRAEQVREAFRPTVALWKARAEKAEARVAEVEQEADELEDDQRGRRALERERDLWRERAQAAGEREARASALRLQGLDTIEELKAQLGVARQAVSGDEVGRKALEELHAARLRLDFLEAQVHELGQELGEARQKRQASLVSLTDARRQLEDLKAAGFGMSSQLEQARRDRDDARERLKVERANHAALRVTLGQTDSEIRARLAAAAVLLNDAIEALP